MRTDLYSGSAVVTIGAATLADVYEPHERGTMMGIFYAAPLLGLSMGPLLGGVLTQLFNWRATFWFLAIFGGLSLLSFVLFKDTFRRERSLTYQAALLKVHDANRKIPERHGSTGLSPVMAQTATAVGLQVPPDLKANKSEQEVIATDVDVEGRDGSIPPAMEGSYVRPQEYQDINLSLRGVNPFTPLLMILRRRNNLAILAASGKFTCMHWFHNSC